MEIVSTPKLGENDQQLVTVCRCCLIEGRCKDISTEYYDCGQREVYEEMLKDTLDIRVSHQADKLACICEDCIVRLREAKNFKDMIIQSQETLSKLISNILGGADKEPITKESDSKLEDVNDEVSADCVVTSDDATLDGNGEDQVILANLKRELNTRKETNIRTGVRARRKLAVGGTTSLTRRKRGVPSTEKQSVEKHDKPQKDWLKIAERRGNGPLLREASMTLIANSTACVFQWNKSRYRCFCCAQPCADVAQLRAHTRAHTPAHIEKKIIAQQNRLVKVEVSSLSCKICGTRLESLQLLKEHLKTHGLKFESEEDLLVPFKIDTNTLQCQICSQSFTMFRLLNIHMNRHYQKQVCHICGAGFSNLVFLNLHKSRSHRQFSCKQCKISFKDKSDKKSHDISVHGFTEQRRARFPCPYCQHRFSQEKLRVQHLVDEHGLKKPEHICCVCSKVFITCSLRNNHMKKVHLKERNSKCDVCHHLFYTKSDLARHKVTHTGEKQFSCTSCNNLFSTKDSLRRHTKRAHGSKL